MTTVYDVPADKLIEETKEKLKEMLEAPEWAKFVKTGVHREKAPEEPDWWYRRVAALLRKIYIFGPIGVERLRTEYGGKKDRGSKRYKFRRGSGSVIRKALQQLEELGFLERTEDGRRVTPKGRSFLDSIANDIKKNFPELSKY